MSGSCFQIIEGDGAVGRCRRKSWGGENRHEKRLSIYLLTDGSWAMVTSGSLYHLRTFECLKISIDKKKS